MMKYYPGFAVLLLLISLAACTKPTLIGADFLEDEKTGLAISDQFSLEVFTEKTDSVLVHSNNLSSQLTVYLIGNLEDPIFGTSKAEIFTQPVIASVGSHLIGSTIDSVVLTLRYDTLGAYGPGNENVTLTVFEMQENPVFEQRYFSNHKFISNPVALGEATFRPSPKDSLEVKTPSDTSLLAPHIRIPLDVERFHELLLLDTSVWENADTFINAFNGLHIVMSAGNQTMLGFDLTDAVSGVTIYFDKGATLDQQYRLLFSSGSVKTTYFEHNYTGSTVGTALDPTAETEYFYIQGMSGVTSKVVINGIESIGNAGVNYATLDVYSTYPPGDIESAYPTVPFIITQEKTDSSTISTFDVAVALSVSNGNYTGTTYEKLYGGKAVKLEGTNPPVYKYTMTVTKQIQDIHKGLKTNVLYLNPISKANAPNRSVIFGTDNVMYAPKLTVYYTEL